MFCGHRRLEWFCLCGFVGLLNPAGLACERSTGLLVADMRDRLAHRGPDDAGTWMDATAGIALGARRLAVVDLSPAGHQPMMSSDGRWVLTLNGEIYNAPSLRRALDDASGTLRWRGHSDTEVLVESIARWGVVEAVTRANGMFAIAAWDRQSRTLFLARDHIGMKPLYYAWAGTDFVFGSELKALWRHPDFDTRVDGAALSDFLSLGYVLGTQSIFQGARKVPPGHVMALGPGASPRSAPVLTRYWDLKDTALRGLDACASGNIPTIDELDSVLHDAVAIRMTADVPVGALLSGGIDSSLIAGLMARRTGQPIHTFSVGFGLSKWDETSHARAVAAHLGTVHHETVIRPNDVLGLMGDLAEIFDEPLADDSTIPTTLLSRAARREVTVALSGDGGDEFFAGYDRYRDAARWLARRRAAPQPLRWLAGVTASGMARPLADFVGWGRGERRLRLLGELLSDDVAEHFNAAIMSRSPAPADLTTAGGRRCNPLMADAYCLGHSTDIDRIMFMDSGTFLIDDILAKVDRASMSTALEVRCPLLDRRVIEMAWRFPAERKSDSGRGKLPLRAVLDRYVPRGLVDRPKMGFTAPVHIWLRDTLRPWAEALMTREALGRHGLLNVDACRRVWEDYAVRGRGWNPLVWSLLTFQAWHEAMTRSTATRHVRTPGLLPTAGGG